MLLPHRPDCLLSRRGRTNLTDSSGCWTGKSWIGICSHPAQHWFHGNRSTCHAVRINLGKIDKVGCPISEMRTSVSGKTNKLHEPKRLSARGNSAVLQDRVVRDSG